MSFFITLKMEDVDNWNEILKTKNYVNDLKRKKAFWFFFCFFFVFYLLWAKAKLMQWMKARRKDADSLSSRRALKNQLLNKKKMF